MRYADANVIKIKHAVLEEVARLAFAGELEERKDEIAFKLIPGPTPQFRCCIYKEREIIRSASAWRKAKRREQRTTAILSRSSVQPARTVRSPATP